MESDCICLFCQRSDLTLYEINNNDVIIGSEIVSFQDLIYEVFVSKININVVNSICEECKNLITDFYVFKNTAKQNLQISKAFAYLKEFLDSNQSDPVVRITQNQFIVSFEDTDEYPDEDDGIVEEIEEEVYEQDEPMRIEEDQVSYSYDVDAAHASSSEDGFTDQEFENEVKPTRPAERLKCDCGEILFSAQELALHLNQHKSKSGKTKLSCQEKTCNIDFKDPKYMEMHEKAHENFKAVAPHLPSFICTHCRSMFAVEDDYITHIAYHQVDGELNHQYLIERRSAYDDHMLRSIKSSELEDETDVEELYSCGYCDKKTIEFDMKIHLLFFHTHIVSCPFDNRVFDGFKQVRLFSEHVRNKHPEIFEKSDLFTCRHCNSSFESHFEKLAHMKQCEGKLFACEGHCDKRFATDWLRKLHMRQVQGIDRFSCEICKKVCVSKSDLQIHNRSHTNERPYECPICLKCFKTSANRSSHMDIHEPGKRHACDICGEKFQTRPIMRKHKKKHDSKYMSECVCKICHRQYITKPHMLRHVKDFHAAPPELKTTGLTKYFENYVNSKNN